MNVSIVGVDGIGILPCVKVLGVQSGSKNRNHDSGARSLPYTDVGDYPGHWAPGCLKLLGLSARDLLNRAGSLTNRTWAKWASVTTLAAACRT